MVGELLDDNSVDVIGIGVAESKGLKRGGVLNIVRHEIEFYCPADSIPEEIVVDLTGLHIGQSIHVSQVKLPEGAQPTIADRDFTIATIASAASGQIQTYKEDLLAFARQFVKRHAVLLHRRNHGRRLQLIAHERLRKFVKFLDRDRGHGTGLSLPSDFRVPMSEICVRITEFTDPACPWAYSAEPDNADFAYNLAVSLDHLRQPKLALEYYQRAIALAKARGGRFDLGAAEGRVTQLTR